MRTGEDKKKKKRLRIKAKKKNNKKDKRDSDFVASGFEAVRATAPLNFGLSTNIFVGIFFCKNAEFGAVKPHFRKFRNKIVFKHAMFGLKLATFSLSYLINPQRR